jgi:hypothetical protein
LNSSAISVDVGNRHGILLVNTSTFSIVGGSRKGALVALIGASFASDERSCGAFGAGFTCTFK